MRCVTVYHLINPSTGNSGRAVEIVTVYSGTDEEMNQVEKFCKENIGYCMKCEDVPLTDFTSLKDCT